MVREHGCIIRTCARLASCSFSLARERGRELWWRHLLYMTENLHVFSTHVPTQQNLFLSPNQAALCLTVDFLNTMNGKDVSNAFHSYCLYTVYICIHSVKLYDLYDSMCDCLLQRIILV